MKANHTAKPVCRGPSPRRTGWPDSGIFSPAPRCSGSSTCWAGRVLHRTGSSSAGSHRRAPHVPNAPGHHEPFGIEGSIGHHPTGNFPTCRPFRPKPARNYIRTGGSWSYRFCRSFERRSKFCVINERTQSQGLITGTLLLRSIYTQWKNYPQNFPIQNHKKNGKKSWLVLLKVLPLRCNCHNTSVGRPFHS